MRTWNVSWESTARLLLGIEPGSVAGVFVDNIEPVQTAVESACGAPYPGAMIELGPKFEYQFIAQDANALVAFFVRHGLITAKLGRELLNEYTLQLAGG